MGQLVREASIYNDPVSATTNTLALVHSVPTVYVVAPSGLAIKSYIAAQGAAATASNWEIKVPPGNLEPILAEAAARAKIAQEQLVIVRAESVVWGDGSLAARNPEWSTPRLWLTDIG